MRGALNLRLLALLVGGVGVTVAGVSVVGYVVAPGVTVPQLLDAGITVDASPRWLSCWVCGEPCGGGCCQRRIPYAIAKTLPSDGGDREVIFAGRAQVQRFRALVSQFGEDAACRRVPTTWAQVADFSAAPEAEVPLASASAWAGRPACCSTAGRCRARLRPRRRRAGPGASLGSAAGRRGSTRCPMGARRERP